MSLVTKIMNINNRLNRLTIVDKQYKLRQVLAKNNKSVVQLTRKSNRSENVVEPLKKAA